MSQTTITTPAGKIRTQSRCRFVLIGWRKGEGFVPRPFIAKRSDSVETIRKARKSKGFSSTEGWMIFDTTTKEEVTS